MCRFFRSLELWQKIAFISGITTLVIIFLIFLAVWVIFPIVFMCNISVQTFFIFFNYQDPKNPEFNNPKKYGLESVANFYITTKDINNRSLQSIGTWLILPENEINITKRIAHNEQSVSEILRATNSPIIMYQHGVGCNRVKPIETYNALRKHFMVVAMDHRGYGDSGPGVPSEQGIISDTVQIFKWIRTKTNNDIYIWGHSLGTGITTHSVRRLKEHDIVPMGMVLESAFTTIREEIPANQLGKIFSWMPWFEATILDPLERNGFHFKSTTNILFVDSPIMILHAQDDNVVPYTLGEKVYKVASNERNMSTQGNVTYHLFGLMGYGHTGITNDPHISKYIQYWSQENPYWMTEEQTQFLKKINVWTGIIKGIIIAPSFVDRNLNENLWDIAKTRINARVNFGSNFLGK